MLGLNLLQQLLTEWSWSAQNSGKSGSSGSPQERLKAKERAGRPALGWLRVFVLAGVVGGVVCGVVPSCAIPDPDYCETNAACQAMSTGLSSIQLLCDLRRHVCVPPGGPLNCALDDDCPDYQNPRCDTSTNTCTGCRVGDSSSCGHLGTRPFCVNATNGSASTLCVACRTGAECPMTAPICDQQQCRKCAAHSDCEGDHICDSGLQCTDSLVCIQEGDLTPEKVGQCAMNGSAGQVVYVVNDVATCNDMTHPGTAYSMPLCSFEAGWTTAQMQGRRFIRLLGPFDATSGPHSQINIGAGSYSFIGAPAKSYTDMVSITYSGLLFSVSGTGSLTVDGLHIIQKAAAAATNLKCVETGSTPPSFTLRHSTLTGGDSPVDAASGMIPAVFINTCNTIIDGNIIGVATFADVVNPLAAVHGTAISISDAPMSGTSYLIQNNVIAGNAGAALNLLTAGLGSAKIVVRFNTIVGNGRGLSGPNGTVICPAGTPLQEFSHSIMVGNYNTVSKTQFDATTTNPGRCNFKNVVVGQDEMGADPASAFPSPLIRLPVDLNTDFRIRSTPNNAACCIDKVAPVGNELLPTLDFNNVPRPQGAKWDIGASEFKP